MNDLDALEQAARAELRRWVFNEFGITGEGAWTQEFDRLLDAAVRKTDALRAERDRLIEVLEQIEAWCDDPLEQIEGKHGTTHRLLMAVIPNTITAVLRAAQPEPSDDQ